MGSPESSLASLAASLVLMDIGIGDDGGDARHGLGDTRQDARSVIVDSHLDGVGFVARRSDDGSMKARTGEATLRRRGALL